MTKQIIGIIALTLGLNACDNNSGIRANRETTYQEKVKTIEEIERSQPTTFLSVSGTYKQNFWSDKFTIHGVIKNAATVATYKDAVVIVSYFSKTKTKLASKNYTIYDFFPPHSEKTFELEVNNYKDLNSIGCDIEKATPN